MKNIKFLISFLFFLKVYLVSCQALPAFRASPFPQNQCNNLKGNYDSEWKPSHGSPSVLDLGCGNKVVRLYSKNESISSKKSEGIFIDLTKVGINLNSSKKYKIIVTYRYSLPSNPNRAINFDVYFANGLVEKSSDNCDEEKEPTVSDKVKILSFAKGEFLNDTYTCQVKSKEQGGISISKTYRYLWIVSNINTTLTTKEYVDIDKVELYYDNIVPPIETCKLSTPVNLSFFNITPSSATFKWDVVNNASKYRVKVYPLNVPDYSNTLEATSNSYDFNNLVPNTEYLAEVRAVCASGISSTNISYKSFTTPCYPKITNIIVAPYYSSYKLDFSEISSVTSYNIEWVNLNTSESGTRILEANNKVFYWNNTDKFKIRIGTVATCPFSDWIIVDPLSFPCNSAIIPQNLTFSNACTSCYRPGRFDGQGYFIWDKIANVNSFLIEYVIFSVTNPSQVITGTITAASNQTYSPNLRAPYFTGTVYIKYRVKQLCNSGTWSNWSSNFAW